MARSPQRHHFVVLLLLSLCVLLLYCHSNTSLPVSISASQNPNPDPRFLPNSRLETRAPTPGFTLLIKVLAFNRLDSISRCLRSLAAADYRSDTVHLHVYIDHFDNRSGDVESSLDVSRKILDFVDGFKWEFGDKLVHHRTGNAGLQAQWLEAWWPTSDDEFAFIVEDDLEVSPLFYKFVKSVIWNYYYNASNFSPIIYGVTLQRPRFVPGTFHL